MGCDTDARGLEGDAGLDDMLEGLGVSEVVKGIVGHGEGEDEHLEEGVGVFWTETVGVGVDDKVVTRVEAERHVKGVEGKVEGWERVVFGQVKQRRGFHWLSKLFDDLERESRSGDEPTCSTCPKFTITQTRGPSKELINWKRERIHCWKRIHCWERIHCWKRIHCWERIHCWKRIHCWN